MPQLARLTLETQGEVDLAHVAGEVDASNVADLSQQLLDAVSNHTRAVVLDLSDTSYIDSSGISAQLTMSPNGSLMRTPSW